MSECVHSLSYQPGFSAFTVLTTAGFLFILGDTSARNAIRIIDKDSDTFNLI